MTQSDFMMRINFINDVAELYRIALADKCGGYDHTPEKIIIDFIKFHQRTLKKMRRTIKSYKNFVVPDDVKNGLKLLEACAKKGEDINPFLSKQSIKSKTNDIMLNDWGIYHFHLGENIEKSGFAERTGLLLYAFVTDECIYEICIQNHGEWSNPQLLEIINQKWPYLLKPFFSNLSNINYTIDSPDEITGQRQSCQNYILTLSDGTNLSSPGGGFSVNGTSEYVTDTFIYLKQEIKRLERKAKDYYQNYNDCSKITLCVNDSDVYATIDTNSKDKIFFKVHDELEYLFRF